ncbi:MAG TPA: potassium-transporting ATPase subunit KdpA [Bdellovibrionota bacterium]|jgi:K+-transporting ATPase ATPase A chain|nr:potassium-transporting ATPase subunit KdpA [Bdellovibrionota bacterium]
MANLFGIPSTDLGHLLVFLVVTLAVGLSLSRWLTRSLDGPALLPRVESALYRFVGVNPLAQMNWRQYLGALVTMHLVGLIFTFAILMLQGHLPYNPQKLPGLEWSLALNTAISFVTNTNWQAYSGEASLSYFSQFAALTVQNFLSAAVGIAVLATLARALRQSAADQLGNFWVDLTRATLYVLVPLSCVWALLLVGQGVVQTLAPYLSATTLEGGTQLIPLGPAASQIAIKQLGTNGGGFFGVNSAHPFENPTGLANFLEMIAILAIPVACVDMFGRMIGNLRHGRALLIAMATIFVPLVLISLWSEFHYPLALEGKELRFGIGSSVLWSQVTTAASNGSVNAMHGSLSPLAGGLALVNMLLGEIIFGGVGSGTYGMVLYVILAIFLAGLMVGRTPEYLGKKIQATEVKWAALGIILPSAVVLLGTALSVLTESALASRANVGPHGLSEILYAWASAANNNGSAFAGLSANTSFYNLGLGLAMLVGRFGVLVPVLVIAGSMAQKKSAPPSVGTFPSEGGLFITLLVGTILIVGALTFFPVLSLGPVVEHLLMGTGKAF